MSTLNNREVALLFTDLVGFSSMTLAVGDDTTLMALRLMNDLSEPLIARHGMVIKRLGDGVMASFRDGQRAVEAAIAVRNAVHGIAVDRYTLRLRVGIHLGQPRLIDDHLGLDYIGLDVNIAARVCTAAGPGEILVSSPTASILDTRDLALHSRKPLRAKGVPAGVDVETVEPCPRH